MKNFDELFEKAMLHRNIEAPKNEFHKAVLNSLYTTLFNNWLQENRGWEYGNEAQYKELLTKENWLEFLRNKRRQDRIEKEKFEIEDRSWQLEDDAPPQPIVKQKPELKIDQIALKFAYEGLQITRENGNEIAKEYGHNSGEKLFHRFTYFSSSANRKGKPNLCTPKKLDNKIKLIESIIELLPTDKQERAKDEVSILKKIYEAEYQ